MIHLQIRIPAALKLLSNYIIHLFVPSNSECLLLDDRHLELGFQKDYIILAKVSVVGVKRDQNWISEAELIGRGGN